MIEIGLKEYLPSTIDLQNGTYRYWWWWAVFLLQMSKDARMHGQNNETARKMFWTLDSGLLILDSKFWSPWGAWSGAELEPELNFLERAEQASLATSSFSSHVAIMYQAILHPTERLKISASSPKEQ